MSTCAVIVRRRICRCILVVLSIWFITIGRVGGACRPRIGIEDVVSMMAHGALSVFAADLDQDGDMDILSASVGDDKIAWYENTDGNGTFGTQQVITTMAFGAYSVYAVDLDEDGDMDVLSASRFDDKIAWYENTDGNGTFGQQQVITTLADSAQSVYAADLDQDGDVDVLSASFGDDKIAWYENTDGNGTFGAQQVITTLANGAHAVFAADLDQDGDMDVLSASFFGNPIAWYENTDGDGTFGQQQVMITTQASSAYFVFAADVDQDGDMDVLSALASGSTSKIAWYENTDGNGTFGEQQVITTQANLAISVYAADLDQDGDMDVLSASFNDNKIAWYENTDGNGTFGAQQVITTLADGAYSVFAADLDEDGDMDVLSASFSESTIAWYEHTDSMFGPQQVITVVESGVQEVITTLANDVRSVYAVDLDQDGDVDVLSASFGDNKIAWYENTDSKGTFGAQQVITTLANGATSVYAADLDQDGDTDVLSASFNDNKIAWYENTDGNGTFGAQQVITSLANGATSVYAVDLDQDGDIDVMSANSKDHKIAWYENKHGNGTFGAQQVITTLANVAQSVYAADLDLDGDMDVLSASTGDDKIAWYENTHGNGTFGPQQVITTLANGAFSVIAADLDHDGDMDVLSASDSDDKIAWYENTDGSGTFGTPQVITTLTKGARLVFTADLDHDGDVDVLSASASDGKIAWYENTDGNGTFGAQRVITTLTVGAYSVFAADLDQDGDMDVLSASRFDDKIAWYENNCYNAPSLSPTLSPTTVPTFSPTMAPTSSPTIVSTESPKTSAATLTTPTASALPTTTSSQTSLSNMFWSTTTLSVTERASFTATNQFVQSSLLSESINIGLLAGTIVLVLFTVCVLLVCVMVLFRPYMSRKRAEHGSKASSQSPLSSRSPRPISPTRSPRGAVSPRRQGRADCAGFATEDLVQMRDLCKVPAGRKSGRSSKRSSARIRVRTQGLTAPTYNVIPAPSGSGLDYLYVVSPTDNTYGSAESSVVLDSPAGSAYGAMSQPQRVVAYGDCNICEQEENIANEQYTNVPQRPLAYGETNLVAVHEHYENVPHKPLAYEDTNLVLQPE